MMSDKTIKIMDLPLVPKSTLYYYQGNFYYPFTSIPPGNLLGKINLAIKKFIEDNKDLVEKDRNSHDYKTLPQLFSEQERQFAVIK